MVPSLKEAGGIAKPAEPSQMELMLEAEAYAKERVARRAKAAGGVNFLNELGSAYPAEYDFLPSPAPSSWDSGDSSVHLLHRPSAAEQSSMGRLMHADHAADSDHLSPRPSAACAESPAPQRQALSVHATANAIATVLAPVMRAAVRSAVEEVLKETLPVALTPTVDLVEKRFDSSLNGVAALLRDAVSQIAVSPRRPPAPLSEEKFTQVGGEVYAGPGQFASLRGPEAGPDLEHVAMAAEADSSEGASVTASIVALGDPSGCPRCAVDATAGHLLESASPPAGGVPPVLHGSVSKAGSEAIVLPCRDDVAGSGVGLPSHQDALVQPLHGARHANLRLEMSAVGSPAHEHDMLDQDRQKWLIYGFCSQTQRHSQLQEEVRRITQKLGDMIRVCILSGKELRHASSALLIKSMARGLAAGLRGRAAFILNGTGQVQKAFAENCGDGTQLWTLLPFGQVSGYTMGADIHAGMNFDQCDDVFQELGDVCISVEGGPNVSQMARAAMARGASVVPLMRTGGASSGMFDFPRGALERPPSVSAEAWDLLARSDAPIFESAAAAVDIVTAFALAWEDARRPPGEDLDRFAWERPGPAAGEHPTQVSASEPCRSGPRGVWADEEGGFLGGAAVDLRARAWRPVGPGADASQAVTHARAVISPASWELLTLGADGSECNYELAMGPHETLVVRHAASEAQWTLSRVPDDRGFVAGASPRGGPGTPRSGLGNDPAGASRLGRVVSSGAFDHFCMLLVVANAVLAGYCVQHAAAGLPAGSLIAAMVFHHVFAAAFALEWALRLGAAGGRAFFWGWDAPWNCLDTAVVAAAGGELAARRTAFVFVFRLLRVLGAARALRMGPRSRDLDILAASFRRALVQVAWLVGVVLVHLYILAIFVVPLAAEQRRAAAPAGAPDGIQRYFGSLPRAAYFLLQAATGGVPWGELADAALEVSWVHAAAVLLCMCFIVFVLLNGVTSALVHGVIQQVEVERAPVVVAAASSCADATIAADLLEDVRGMMAGRQSAADILEDLRGMLSDCQSTWRGVLHETRDLRTMFPTVQSC